MDGMNGIETGMLRRLRVLFVFVGAVWLALGILRLALAASAGGPVPTALALTVGTGFLLASVLAHLELRRRRARPSGRGARL
ncbi:MAG: hypothetical protein QM635_08870 [Microbacteriaceae bacterium]